MRTGDSVSWSPWPSSIRVSRHLRSTSDGTVALMTLSWRSQLDGESGSSRVWRQMLMGGGGGWGWSDSSRALVIEGDKSVWAQMGGGGRSESGDDGSWCDWPHTHGESPMSWLLDVRRGSTIASVWTVSAPRGAEVSMSPLQQWEWDSRGSASAAQWVAVVEAVWLMQLSCNELRWCRSTTCINIASE